MMIVKTVRIKVEVEGFRGGWRLESRKKVKIQ
jgi:hypothetical protein